MEKGSEGNLAKKRVLDLSKCVRVYREIVSIHLRAARRYIYLTQDALKAPSYVQRERYI